MAQTNSVWGGGTNFLCAQQVSPPHQPFTSAEGVAADICKSDVFVLRERDDLVGAELRTEDPAAYLINK